MEFSLIEFLSIFANENCIFVFTILSSTKMKFSARLQYRIQKHIFVSRYTMLVNEKPICFTRKLFLANETRFPLILRQRLRENRFSIKDNQFFLTKTTFLSR